MTLQLLHRHEEEWKIGSLVSDQEEVESSSKKAYTDSEFITPSFCPLPIGHSKIPFYFKGSCTKIYDVKSPNLVTLKLKLCLEKDKLIKTSSSLLMIIGVKINWPDSSTFKEYHRRLAINLNEINRIWFKEVQFDPVNPRIYDILKTSLILKCHVACYDQTSSQHLKNDQETFPTKSYNLIKNFKSVYNPSVLSDFVINVGDKSFLVHKVILAAHSPVFMKMMTSDFLESKTNSVTITHATPEIFDTFLEYLYSGEIADKSWSTVKELYYLAHKYEVGVLISECSDIATSDLSLDFICDILKIAYDYDDSQLQSTAKSFATEHIKELLLRNDWKNLVKTHPMIGYEIASNFFPK